jgi:hypothetical protein
MLVYQRIDPVIVVHLGKHHGGQPVYFTACLEVHVGLGHGTNSKISKSMNMKRGTTNRDMHKSS